MQILKWVSLLIFYELIKYPIPQLEAQKSNPYFYSRLVSLHKDFASTYKFQRSFFLIRKLDYRWLAANFYANTSTILTEKTVFYSIQYKNLLKYKLSCFWPFHMFTQSLHKFHRDILKFEKEDSSNIQKMNGCSFQQFLRQNLSWFLQGFERRSMSVELIRYVETTMVFYKFYDFFCRRHYLMNQPCYNNFF